MIDWPLYLAALRQSVPTKERQLKNPLKSKTLWLNLLAALATWFVDLQGQGVSAQTQVAVLAGLNAGARFLTHAKLSFDA